VYRVSESGSGNLLASRCRVAARILVVDDDPSAVRKLRDALADHDVEVESASNVVAGVAAVANGTFCALVLDLVLGDGSGFDVLRAMDRQGIVIPTVVVSGKLPAYVREMLHEDQVKLVFPKGSDPRLIAAVVLGLCEP
jgi:DNA-binding NtrC family response regulator